MNKIAPGLYEVDGFLIERRSPRGGVRAGKVTRWYITRQNGEQVGSADTLSAALAFLKESTCTS